MICLIATTLMWFEFWEMALLFIAGLAVAHPIGYMQFFTK